MQGRKSKGAKAATGKDEKKKATAKKAAPGTAKGKSAQKGKATASRSAAHQQAVPQGAAVPSPAPAAPPATTSATRPAPSAISHKPTTPSPRTISRSEWHREVELEAYRRAELRHFTPGGEQDDWIEAEADVNERLLRLGIQVVD